MFRSKDSVRSIPLTGWYTDDIAQLSKKFAFETVKITGKKTDTVKIELDTLLVKQHTEKNLNIIGGFVSNANKEETLNLFFYKTDAVKNQAARPKYDIFIEPYQMSKTAQNEEEMEVALNSSGLE